MWNPNGWTWTQDRQWATSRFSKTGNVVNGMDWAMDVRTEAIGGEGKLMGVMHIKGSPHGVLTLSLELL